MAAAAFVSEAFEAACAGFYNMIYKGNAFDTAAAIAGAREEFVYHKLGIAISSPLGAVKGSYLHLHSPFKLRYMIVQEFTA